MIGIVLPTKDGGESFKHAVKSIINTTNYPYKLLIIENGSTDGTKEVADSWADQFEQIEAYHIECNGYIDAMNFGIEKAKELGCEGVYFTQDDVIHFPLYEKDWLQMIADISKIEECGQVISINGGSASGPDYLDGLFWAGTWSMYIPMKIIDEIGLFDISFNPGQGDDIDYSYRVQKAGYQIYVAQFWVDHHRKKEHPMAAEQIKKDHAEYFRKKWKLGEFKEVKNGKS